jgi:hypothetical protein
MMRPLRLEAEDQRPKHWIERHAAAMASCLLPVMLNLFRRLWPPSLDRDGLRDHMAIRIELVRIENGSQLIMRRHQQ